MIKLLWNTHNQNKPTVDKLNDKRARDYVWGVYHKENSEKWIFEILNEVKFKPIQNLDDLELGDTLIIVDSSVENKKEFYTKLKLICSKMYLVHLGDETGSYDLTTIYNNFNFIWRTFCFNQYFQNQKVACLPIGYKSGTIFLDNIEKETYKWAFVGTPHKSSRHDLVFQLSDIKPFFLHKTNKFNEKIINVDEMSKVLSSTQFIPCPNGFVHPETYRLYEALECECIPIVENTYKYYDRLFPNNPFIKVDKWMNAKLIINQWSKKKIEEKKEECKAWWIKKKNKLKISIREKLLNE